MVARSVYGSTAASLYEIDRKWARQTGSIDKQQYRVHLNGQAMAISSHMTDKSIRDVLKAAEDECRAHTGGLDGEFTKLPGYAMAKLTSFVFGVVHQEWADHGYVACIERDGNRGVAGLASDVRDLMKTGDISKLGTFRYVEADRGKGTTKTHVLRQWTEGEFSLAKMFPAEGDVPGSDLAEVPRPAGGRRILEASVNGSPLGVRVYDSPGAPEAILAGYEKDFVSKGWKSVSVPEKDAQKMRVFDQGESDVFISASRTGARTVVSISDLPPN